MAFYAEMLRRDSWLVNGANMIYFYQNVLTEAAREEYRKKKEEYDKWYESLTDEQRQELEERKRRRDEAELRNIMAPLLAIGKALSMVYDREYDKYDGLYNRDGSINRDYFRDKAEREAIEAEAVEM